MDSQFQQFAMDSGRTPSRVFVRHRLAYGSNISSARVMRQRWKNHCRALGVTLKPWLPVLPLRRKSKSIMIRHLHLRQALLIHNLVFLNDSVLVQQEGGDGIDLIGGERPLFPDRHAAIDVIPDRRREG